MQKTAVFLCRCFGEIDSVVDLELLRRKAAETNAVVSSYISDSLCFSQDIKKTAALARECGAEKVVIGACSFLARGEIITSGLVKEGIDHSQIGIVDLREACAWIHGNDKTGATQKAWDQLVMEISALEHRQKSDDVAVEVRPEAAIIGAGSAGLSAALALARLDFNVHLIEKGANLGGMLNLLSRLYPSDEKASERINKLIDNIKDNPRIKTYTKAKITSVTGFAGDFKIKISSSGEHILRVGAVIIASGARVLLPYGLYGYGKLKHVVTQMELERQIIKDRLQINSAVFIQCAGARNKERPYCAAMCCPSAIKNAITILEENPRSRVFILHRDIMTPGDKLEAYYRNALAKGVQFIRFDEEDPPTVLGYEKAERVEVFDTINGIKRELEADIVVLSTPLIPNEDNLKLADMLGLQLDRYGFFSEIYPLNPLETRIDGIFICGSARWPVSSDTAIIQGEGAAMKAVSIMVKERLSALSLSCVPGQKLGHAKVNTKSCTGCGNCVAACPYDACRLQRMTEKYVGRVNKMRCKGCGNCVSVCPNGTMQLPEHNYQAVAAMIKQAFQEKSAL